MTRLFMYLQSDKTQGRGKGTPYALETANLIPLIQKEGRNNLRNRLAKKAQHTFFNDQPIYAIFEDECMTCFKIIRGGCRCQYPNYIPFELLADDVFINARYKNGASIENRLLRMYQQEAGWLY